MEKRSHRRIRDLVAHPAFQGLDANENGCVRISMMARRKHSFKGPNTDARDQFSSDRHFQLATHGRSIQKCHSRLNAFQQTAYAEPALQDDDCLTSPTFG
jgi:hypothetical protein